MPQKIKTLFGPSLINPVVTSLLKPLMDVLSFIFMFDILFQTSSLNHIETCYRKVEQKEWCSVGLKCQGKLLGRDTVMLHRMSDDLLLTISLT